MICPKCGFDQPDDIYCVFCGVNIEKHLRQKKRRRYKGGILAGLIGLVALCATVYFTSSYKTEHPDEAIEDSKSLVESTKEALAPAASDLIHHAVKKVVHRGRGRRRKTRKQRRVYKRTYQKRKHIKKTQKNRSSRENRSFNSLCTLVQSDLYLRF